MTRLTRKMSEPTRACRLFRWVDLDLNAMDHSVPMLANFEVLPDMLTAKDLEALLQIDRKTIYAYVQRGLIPHVRIESNVRFSKHQVMRWLEERSFQPRLVHGKGTKRH